MGSLRLFVALSCLVLAPSIGLADTVDNLVRMHIQGTDDAEGKTTALRAAYDLFDAKKFDQAFAALKQTHENYPTLPPGRLLLALFFLDGARTNEARQQLEAAAIEYPDSPLTYDAFGRLALIEGHVTDAELHFERAARLIKKSNWDQQRKDRAAREANLGLAAVAERRQQWETAQARLEKALQAKASDPPTRRRLAQTLFRLDQYDPAFEQLTAAAESDPEQEPPEILMARLHSGVGNQEQAESWIKIALQKYPENVRVLVTYGAWLLDRGREVEAADSVKQAIKLAPEEPAVKSLLAVLAHAVGKFGIAEQYLQELHNSEPGNFEYSNYLALALAEQENERKLGKAFQLAENNARLYPRDERAQATLGWVYHKLGRNDMAESFLNRAVSGGRASADTVYFYSRIAAELGRIEEARKMLPKALENDGRFLYRSEAKEYLDQITVGNVMSNKTSEEETGIEGEGKHANDEVSESSGDTEVGENGNE